MQKTLIYRTFSFKHYAWDKLSHEQYAGIARLLNDMTDRSSHKNKKG